MPPSIDFENGRVEMSHGSGGKASSDLVEALFMRAFDNPWLQKREDQATFDLPKGRVVMATDSHVISPLFFPGGDIGCLSVHGTINDVVMSGAEPCYLSTGFILEEGFPLKDLKKIVDSMANASHDAGVPIVTGDTKVVERGKGDGVYINTTGVGVIADGIELGPSKIQAGDAILVNGTLGDHGVAIMSKREHLEFETPLLSDTQALNDLVQQMISAVPNISCMRDPTRGGLSSTLNELSEQTKLGMVIYEDKLPLRPEVKAACELLGLDPLHVANEGKLVCFCPAQHAEALLMTMKNHPKGEHATIIGQVIIDHSTSVQMQTVFGGRRKVDWINGEQLPRIC